MMWKGSVQIAILVTVGAIAINSSHGGRSCSSSRQRQQLFRWRRVRSPMPMPMMASEDEDDRDLRIKDCLIVHSSSKKIILSYSVWDTVMACARGGGGSIEDDARKRQLQQQRQGGHDDRLPDRSSSSSSIYDDSYDNSDGRNRHHRSGPRPSREDGARVPPPRSDRSAEGSEGPRPPQREGRERRDYHSMGGIDDDRSLWNGRERSRGFDRRDHFDERNRRGLGNPRSRQPNYDGDGHGKSNTTTTRIAKRKAWFASKNDRGKVSQNDGVKTEPGRDLDDRGNNIYPFPPPPPPPPPDKTTKVSSHMDINPAQTDRVPIHYMFPTADSATEKRQLSDTRMNDNEIYMMKSKMDDARDVPYLEAEVDFLDRDRGRRRRIRENDEDEIELDHRRASPRRDAVTIFMTTRRGAMKVRVGSIIVGAAIGGFIGKSLTNDPITMAAAVSSALFVTGFLRNDYGELSRALGLAFVLTLGRTGSVRKEYPTLPHLKAMIRQGPRKPFPPIEDGDSPWRYEPVYGDDPDFKMAYALLAMSCVGSFCGGNIPLIPAWIGGIIGAVVFASMTTGANARGDLGRTMGMRLVGLIQVVLAINSELRILGKAATVGGLVFDKVMIMDRKHRIKDKIVAICKWGYDKVSKTAEQVKEDLQDERPLRR